MHGLSISRKRICTAHTPDASPTPQRQGQVQYVPTSSECVACDRDSKTVVSARDDAVIGEMDTGKVDACAGGVIPTSGDRRRGAALLGGLTTKDVRDML